MYSLYPSISSNNKDVCDIYHLAKQKKLPFTFGLSISSAKFELLHFDILGPLAFPSVHNHNYFLTIVEDFSRFVWIILLKNTSEVSTHVKNFINMIHTQYNVTPKTVRSDNGLEFLLTDFYASKGILHHRSCVETPQQNARVERKHQHILNVAKALLFQSKLPKQFWYYAISPTPLLGHKTPYQLLYDSLPDLKLSKFLVHCVMLPLYYLTDLNLTLESENVAS